NGGDRYDSYTVEQISSKSCGSYIEWKRDIGGEEARLHDVEKPRWEAGDLKRDAEQGDREIRSPNTRTPCLPSELLVVDRRPVKVEYPDRADNHARGKPGAHLLRPANPPGQIAKERKDDQRDAQERASRLPSCGFDLRLIKWVNNDGRAESRRRQPANPF